MTTPLGLPWVTRMSDLRNHPRLDPTRRVLGKPIRRRLSLGIEGLEVRSLLSQFGAIPLTLVSPDGIDSSIPMMRMDSVLRDRYSLVSETTHGPLPAPNIALQHAHPSWLIVGIETHGVWQDRPRLLLPSITKVQREIPIFEELERNGQALRDVMLVHLASEPRVVYFETVPGADHGALFEISPPPGTAPRMKIDFEVPAEALDVHTSTFLDLIGEYGEDLARVSMPRPGTGLSFVLQATPGTDGTFPDLILGITRVTGSADPAIVSAPPITFTISVDRVNAATGFTDTGFISRTDPDVDLTRWMVAPKIDESTQGGNLSMDNDTEPAIGIGQVIAGSFPLRSAGASGGVLADGESAPQINPLDGAAIDLTLIELSREIASTALETDHSPFVALTTASGFPLLATSRPPILVDSENTEGEYVRAPVVPLIDNVAKDEENEGKSAPRPVALGLGVAAGVTFGFLLPDVIARLAPTAAGKPRPRWSRRNFWQKIN